MEHIFSADLVIDDRNVAYNVDFEDEKYTFRPQQDNPRLPSFELSLQNNEWIEQEAIEPGIKKQAVASLEKYLLSQH
jgi:hypothetical protein